MAQASTKDYAADRVRNIAIVGHGGSGKTTLSESMLLVTGTTTRLGRVEDGNTVSDYHPDEIERKISINASVLHGDWKGTKINVLDTPGYSDFTGDVIGSVRVADTVVTVLKSVEGVEVGTEVAWTYAQAQGLPVLIVVNKVDNENSDLDHAVSMARERFGNDVTLVHMPVNQGLGFDSIVDLLHMKHLQFAKDGTAVTVGDIPSELHDQAAHLHEELVEKIAETDEGLMNKFFEEGTLNESDLETGLRAAFLQRKIFPVLCASGSAGVGIAPLLDFLVQYSPSPVDRGPARAQNLETKEDFTIPLDPSGPPSMFVFKTVSEEHVGELSFFRVYSGTVHAGLDLVNEANGKGERLGQIFLMNGRDRKEVGRLVAGDIGAVVKLKDTHTNNTLSAKGLPVVYPPTVFPEPVIRMAIHSKAKGDEDRVATGLHALHEEDPTFIIHVDGQLSQTIIAGQGELHLLIVTKRLKQKYGVEVELTEPKIPYKEALRAVVADSEYKHKKQTGGRGQFGHVHLKLEPRPRGSGFEFVDDVVGGVVPGRFVPAVEKGVIDSMQRGVIAGYEVVDVRVSIFDGSYHSVDSDEHSFRMAGTMAFKKGFLEGRPVLLEPINEITVTVPEEYMGDVMGDISGRRGKILGMEADGHFQVIKALVPLAEIHKYSTILRSMTQGRGVYRTKFEHYEEVPKEQADKITSAYEKSRAEGE
ncbi:MAG: elongation factor G [Bacteroidota bacterium]